MYSCIAKSDKEENAEKKAEREGLKSETKKRKLLMSKK